MADNYIRPNKTYTERLDDEEIADKLTDYVKVDNIKDVKINTHIRYFLLEVNKDGSITRKFRMGGFLKNKDNGETYVMLSNNKTTWSVQTNQAVFYRKLSIDEIKEEYEKDLKELNELNRKLYKQNKRMKKFIESKGYNISDII